jgi:HPt (histidine-containing phosphotransfer) domain-containing protein
LVIDRSVIEPLMGIPGDSEPEVLVELIDIYRRDSLGLADQVAQAVERADGEALRQVAHKLKGNSRVLGAWRVQDVCQALEAHTQDGVATPVLSELVQRLHEELSLALEELGAVRQELLRGPVS